MTYARRNDKCIHASQLANQRSQLFPSSPGSVTSTYLVTTRVGNVPAASSSSSPVSQRVQACNQGEKSHAQALNLFRRSAPMMIALRLNQDQSLSHLVSVALNSAMPANHKGCHSLSATTRTDATRAFTRRFSEPTIVANASTRLT